MGKFQFERDADFRGYWIEGLVAFTAMLRKQELQPSEYQKEIFIPDTLLRELGWTKEVRVG
ncbi:hypothetical protein LCGC14_0416730 [marine sediment metagenome]|uniref:Uncharacterized protein n=1 Tax=marine sediment metagenome TaxID=412755 RepID=A0A0F9SY34_9ZZZZ